MARFVLASVLLHKIIFIIHLALTFWSSWSFCDATCGNGKQSRNRTCTGVSCEGSLQQYKACNNVKCPGKITAASSVLITNINKFTCNNTAAYGAITINVYAGYSVITTNKMKDYDYCCITVISNVPIRLCFLCDNN